MVMDITLWRDFHHRPPNYSIFLKFCNKDGSYDDVKILFGSYFLHLSVLFFSSTYSRLTRNQWSQPAAHTGVC